jgi:hypothetical protein
MVTIKRQRMEYFFLRFPPCQRNLLALFILAMIILDIKYMDMWEIGGIIFFRLVYNPA